MNKPQGPHLEPGQPFRFKDGEWALIESIKNEYHAGKDEFVDIVTFRRVDGLQCRELLQNLHVEWDDFQNLPCEGNPNL